jgi:hypothetical protein
MLHKGAKQCIRTLVLALEPNIMLNSTSIRWQRVCLPLKSYIVDVDNQVVVWCRCQVMLVTVLLSHADDGAVESCWQRCYRVLLVTALLRRRWSWCDIDAESCWRQWCREGLVTVRCRCREGLVTVRCRCRVILATMLSCHAGDGAAKVPWSWHDVDVESCWQQCCWVMMAMVLSRWLGCGAM